MSQDCFQLNQWVKTAIWRICLERGNCGNTLWTPPCTHWCSHWQQPVRINLKLLHHRHSAKCSVCTHVYLSFSKNCSWQFIWNHVCDFMNSLQVRSSFFHYNKISQTQQSRWCGSKHQVDNMGFKCAIFSVRALVSKQVYRTFPPLTQAQLHKAKGLILT